MRLIMMGTGPFALPTFRRLLDAGHDVPALVTRPPHGRPKEPPNPMRAEAERRGLLVLMPESVNTDEARAELAALSPELLVVCDYGQILRPETLAVARLGGINLHASLLPKYRGAAPINWAIYHGEVETGDTVIHMTPQLDAGPTIAQCRTPIGPEETAEKLEPRLAVLGADLVLASIQRLAAGTVEPIVQDPAQATKAPRLKKSDGEVDWSRSAVQIHNQIRAFQPWPQTYTFWQRQGRQPVRILLRRAEVVAAPVDALPGMVLPQPDELVVATGRGALRICTLQPAGKRELTAVEFLRGNPLAAGERLG